MNIVTKAIRDTTGLTLEEFCTEYLEADWRTFSVRLRKNKLQPNEALLICLTTGKNPQELFGISSLDAFYLKGNESVNVRLRKLLSKPDALEKMNLVLTNEEGLKISLGSKLIDQRKPLNKKVTVIEKVEPKSVKKPVELVQKNIEPDKEDLDFVDINFFK